MKLLLDTHTFLWAIAGSRHLSRRAAGLLSDPENVLLFSVASLWEIVLKHRAGRLPLPADAAVFLSEHSAKLGVHWLPVGASHVYRLLTLPMHHRDPYDRLLVAQSEVEEAPLVSADPVMHRYASNVIW